MSNDEAKLKIIRDTVRNSILSEMSDRLKKRVGDDKKTDEMIALTRSQLKSILNSFSDKELLPNREIESEEDFKKHILKIIDKTRKQLLKDMESEL